MRLLILGGTMFLGRHIVDVAQERGHEVTLFHRGKTNPDLYPDVERILGDRTSDLGLLAGREWDAVIDTCGYHPREVRASAEELRDHVGHYTFVSTISVFSDVSKPGVNEESPVATIPDDDVESATVTGETYGPLKALCEQAAEAAMPGRVANIRPGLIVGPWDPSDRFTYWPARFARGGEVLAPAPREQAVQIIDGRDLAAFCVDAAEQRLSGVYNATGPDRVLTLGEVLDACAVAAATDASVTYVDTDFLDEQDVGMWMEMPLVVWGDEHDGFNAVNVSKAVAAGLRFRPVADTVRDTLTWFQSQPERPWRAGIDPEKEAKVLAAWHATEG